MARNQIYLFVLVDRHEDDKYEAFSNLDVAINYAEERLKYEYGGQYEFEQPDWFTTDEVWLWYRASDNEDGPKAYIQLVDLN